MKKSFFTVAILLCSLVFFGQENIKINAELNEGTKVNLISSNVFTSQIEFNVGHFLKNKINTPKGEAFTISLNEATPILLKGAPDLPKLTASLIIPDKAKMEVRVISSSFVDYENIEIAPSKGNFTRDIDPESVAFTYGRQYQEDRFFPGKLADLREPYIIRDYRGQTVIAYPVQYNPVSKTLRVYSQMTIEITQVSENGFNPLVRKNKEINEDVEFNKIYRSHFLNNNANANRYDVVEEHGNMLIISDAAFLSSIQPLADWRIKTGTPTEIVDVASIGNNAAAIKTYIADYYNNMV
jgi:peptidase C25-like protein